MPLGILEWIDKYLLKIYLQIVYILISFNSACIQVRIASEERGKDSVQLSAE